MSYQPVNLYSVRISNLTVPEQNIEISGLDKKVDTHFPRLQEKRVRSLSKCGRHYIPGIGEIESDIEIDVPEEKDTPRENPDWPTPPGQYPPPKQPPADQPYIPQQ